VVFTQRLKEPPASAFGRSYESIDARCAACTIQGGDEPPCQPEGVLREYERQHGRPCPRVDLAPQNHVAAQLVSFLLDERLRPLAPGFLEVRTGWMDPSDRELLLLRLARALNDAEVFRVLYPELARMKVSRPSPGSRR
jgi:hypothetical protein